MSTSHTASDPGGGRNPRFGRRATPSGRAAPRPAPDVGGLAGAGGPGPGRSAFLDRCRREGKRAARRGQYEAWVLHGEGRPPRLAALASERDQVRQHVRVRAAAEQSAAERAAQLAQAEAESAAAEQRAGAAAREEAEARVAATTGQLDRLAAHEARRRQLRDALSRWVAQRRARRPAPDGGWPSEGLAQVADPDADPGADPAVRAAERTAWEGDAGATVSRGAMLALLACLALVELPIYWSVFRRMHGTGDPASNLLTATFTFAVGTVMIVVPHLLGRLLRGRSATGAPRALTLPAWALVGAWAAACWVLGRLRTSLLAEERDLEVPERYRDVVDPELLRGESVLAELGISEGTMSLLFVVLLLLSGGIAFLLGLGVAHPYVAALRGAADERTRLGAAEAGARRAAGRAAGLAGAHPAETRARREGVDAALREVEDLYEAAAHAYVDGLAAGARDPAVTEAAMRLSAQWPLLPPAPH
ncbi:hypothetical protein RM780_18890 [Streptomyces sp. DSM 44917]|uniref:Integral membrane protein n=1 Tax=Streptomyces boetiae TaxID=3075541 RepID=A0ABU2LBR1_9ACTN|nr:hypothetical protein [Streptomyces sp. DSM 44917]MDT0309010.1 hypothetical protein [Streptomyces sp. DSM 44917]